MNPYFPAGEPKELTRPTTTVHRLLESVQGVETLPVDGARSGSPVQGPANGFAESREPPRGETA